MDAKGFREAIAPTGLVIDKVEFAAGQILITGRFRSPVSICPNCSHPSTCVHSRYHSTLADFPSHGQRTTCLGSIVHHLGLALVGRPAASLARRLLMPVSQDMLLRTARRRFGHAYVKPTVIGIDDWAWKRVQRYGTAVCDLERRCIADLLPDRGVDTVEAWLKSRPEFRIVSRDCGGDTGMRPHAHCQALCKLRIAGI